MGKQVIALSLLLFSICTVHAEYLWCAVSSSDDGFKNVANALSEYGIGNSDDAYVQVVAVKGDEKVDVGDSMGFESAWETGNAPVSLSALGGDAAAYSYYIEIRSTQVSKAIGFSTRVSYTSLSGNITDSISDVPTASAWHGSGYSASPEPTSGVLVLLGSAILALRPKRRMV